MDYSDPYSTFRSSTSLDFHHEHSKYNYSTRAVDQLSRTTIESTPCRPTSTLRDPVLPVPPSSTSSSYPFRFPPSPAHTISRESPSPTGTIRPFASARPRSPPSASPSQSSSSVSLRRSLHPPLPPTPSASPHPIPSALQIQPSQRSLRQSVMDFASEEDGVRARAQTHEVPEDLPVRSQEQLRSREIVPEYDNNEDPFSDERVAGGGEKSRLMETLRTRGDDAESSRSAELGSRDHLERWRSEQTSLEASSLRSRGSDRRNRRIENETNPLVGMSDAEIAQHHFRLAQQHLEAAQRLAMAASQAPAPSAPPSSASSHSHGSTNHGIEEDLFPPSSTSSNTEYPESSFDDHKESPISPESHLRYPSTYSYLSERQAQPRGEELYSEFGRLNLEGTKPLYDGKRSRSLSNSAPAPIPLSSSISEKAPPLPNTTFDSRSLPNESKFATLPPSKPSAQQYPSRISPVAHSQMRRRPSTADSVTPRAIRQFIRRPSTTQGQVSPPPQEPLPPPPPTSHPTRPVPAMVPSLYGGTLPEGMRDRIGPQLSPAPRSTYSSASSSSRSDVRSIQHQQLLSQPEDAFEYESVLDQGGGGGGRRDFSQEGYQELDDFDAGSDYHDVQSTFSHVTNATLPPYEYERRLSLAVPPPPVPSIPHEFRQESTQQSHRAHYPLSSLTASNAGSQVRNVHSSQEDEFHGFRPRLGTGYSLPQPSAPSSVPYPITQSAQWIPPRQDPEESRLYAPPPSTADSQIQPHSYILGADGRPIPVYASLPPPPASLPQQRQASSYPQPPSNYYSSPAPPLPPVTRSPLPIHSEPLQFDHSIHINPSRAHHETPSRPTLSIPSSSRAPSTVSPSASIPSVTHAYHLPPPSTFVQPTLHSLAPSSARPISTTPASTSSEHSSETGATAPSSIIPFMKRNRLVSSGMSLRRMVRSPHVRFKSPEPSIAETTTHGGGGASVGGTRVESEDAKDERNKKAMVQSLGMLM